MRKIVWEQALFVLVSHIAAIVGTILYARYHGFTWTAGAIALAFFLMMAFSISAGYHRLFTHGSYQAHGLLRGFLAFFGAGAFEGSVFRWVEMHRQHHAGSDTEDDPHNIKKGFWWAHVGWVIFGYESKVVPNIDDLKRDWILRFQDRYYILVAIVSGVLLPWGAGYLLHDPWGGLVIGSFLRMVVFHHITWCINSWAHTFGSRPYDPNITARNSLFMALLTMGEGYHNFHHVFPFDYRNGVRWYQWDVTKWAVYLMSGVGLTKNLTRTDQETIEATVRKNRSLEVAEALERLA